MIVDLRIYTIKAGRIADFVACYKEFGWATQSRILGNCVGWYTTIEGELNTVVHMWGYASQADRETRRAAMAADPDWKVYVGKTTEMGLLVKMENRILSPATFSPG